MKRIQELEDVNQHLLSENAALKKRLDEAFNDQQGRIRSVIERERGNLFNDIVSMMRNHERFGLDSLLKYSFTFKWLAERNPVVRLIETLTHNENEHQNEGEKLFKCAVA